MPDWNRLRTSFASGLPNAPRLAAFEYLESLLPLPGPEAQAALAKDLETTPIRLLYGNLLVVTFAIQRDLDIPFGPDANPALAKLLADAQQGLLPAPRFALLQRLTRLWELAQTLIQKDASITQAPSPAELAKEQLQRAGLPIFARLNALHNQTGPGSVTPEILRELEAILHDAEALLAGAAPDNPGLPYTFYMTGGAARTLAQCYALAGLNQQAITAYNRAAHFFQQAAEPAQSGDCRARSADLTAKLAGSLDEVAAKPLAALTATTPGADPFTRIQALLQLASVARDAADAFEALDKAEAAATELVALGYLDPAQAGPENAMDSWIQTATAQAQGIPMLKRLSDVGICYDAILGARFGVLVAKDPAAANTIEDLKFALHKLNAQALAEARDADTAQMKALARYFPNVAPPEPASTSAPPPSRDFLDRCRAIDDALAEIRATCNQRSGTGTPMDDLLAACRNLQKQAEPLNTPEYAAKTRLEEAYVLYHLDRGHDLIPIAQQARQRLLAGRPAQLSCLSEAHQRYLYLESLNRELLGQIMDRNLEAALLIAESTIQDYETERYRVSSDYRQSALLSYVSDFYKWAAFCAFSLKQWDNMLQAIDLIKARSAVRSRLVPDPPAFFESETSRQFDELSKTLAATRPQDPARKPLQDKRREIWDLLAIARAQNGSAAPVPELTLANLQSALADDEALIAYFWLHETVLLAVAVDHERFHAERIVLKPADIELVNDYVIFVQQLKSSHNMDRPVAKLGDLLLPAFLRDFLESKQRVIFSPHHGLHLFPFHAARWDSSFLGTRFAVSYVPNFSSLLLPWNCLPENRLLAIGIKEFADPAVLPLPNVESDVEAFRAFYEAAGTGVEALLGKSATRDRLESLRTSGDLARFRCVHFGTHGLSVFESPDQPLESRLLLQDGALDAMDIANLRLNAELAVLNACHSGQRAIQVRGLGELPGDDIFGLQSALFKSGVRSILGTLWLVETASSSAITRSFHRHFAGGLPAEVALQSAVTEYLSDAARSPGVYYWAPYFISSLGSRPKKEESISCQK